MLHVKMRVGKDRRVHLEVAARTAIKAMQGAKTPEEARGIINEFNAVHGGAGVILDLLADIEDLRNEIQRLQELVE